MKLKKELLKLFDNSTPSYLYNIDDLIDNIIEIKNIVEPEIELCYSIKANPILTSWVNKEISIFEVCSLGEYKIVNTVSKKCTILFGGVYKSYEDILYVSKDDRVIITIESLEQYKKLCAIKEDAKVIVRISSGNQFGCSYSVAEEILKNMPESMKLCGIQYYSGTQCISLKQLKDKLNTWKEAIEKTYSIMNSSQKNMLQFISFGPGLGISYFNTDKEYETTSELVNYLKKYINEHFKVKVLLEMGRVITASCGIYISKIVDEKYIDNNKYYIIDGGSNHIKYFGQSFGARNPKVKIMSENKLIEKYSVCGSLCTENDILLRNCNLTKPNINDFIIFENAGAYCQTEGMSLFLSRDLPKTYIYENKKIKKVQNGFSTYKINNALKSTI